MRISDWSSDVCSSDLIGALTWNTDISYESSTNRNDSFRVDIGKRIDELVLVRDVDHEVQATMPGNPMNDPAGLAFANGMSENINRSRGTLWAVMSDEIGRAHV